jgi:phosphatidylglycerol---prolipoprotein diacylglyceryl transferase
VLGIAFAGYMFSRWAQQKRLPISLDEAHTLLLYAAIGAVLGGRIGYCLFYNLSEVSHHPLEILAIWHGGMASHGGILGLVTAISIFAWRRRRNPLIFLDAAAATGPLGIAFGRIANFVNGELWGKPTSVPRAVIFPDAPTVNGIAVPVTPANSMRPRWKACLSSRWHNGSFVANSVRA